MSIKQALFSPLLLFLFLFQNTINAQQASQVTLERIHSSADFRQEYLGPTQWLNDGEFYTKIEYAGRQQYELVAYKCEDQSRTVLVTSNDLTPEGEEAPLFVEDYSWSEDERLLLIFTNSERVWRSNTRGDYWRFDLDSKELRQVGKGLPEGSLMFAKFSPDNSRIAYVSEFNLYVEDVASGDITQLTQDGDGDIINGTFDWVYEEEFFCRDGFRWSPDGERIAFWQLDASNIRDFYMIDNVSDVYSEIIPVQYPKVGEEPSSCKVGTVNVNDGAIKWIDIPGDPVQHYIPRMQWTGPTEMLVQQLNRKQNELKIYLCNAPLGRVISTYTETEETWVEVFTIEGSRRMDDLPMVNGGKSFLRMSENDGWRHLYRVDLISKQDKILSEPPRALLSKGDYDIARYYEKNEEDQLIYFSASPENATQRYLYSIPVAGSDEPQRLTPESFSGTNDYDISPDGKFAIHTHSSATTPRRVFLVSLPDHDILDTLVANKAYIQTVNQLDLPEVEFFQVTTADTVEMDGMMIKPAGFDENLQYPVLFYVYGEPAGTVANDSWLNLWHVMLAQQGYLVIAMDNRGTPSLKGTQWRKSIYRKIGIVNARDQAMAAREILKWNYVDPNRVAVWGWSGGGSMTLNLLFQYPEIYKTGMSVAPVANQLYYDNIYQERYMGLPQENMEDFIQGSPITHARNLEGNLLLVHGTGDDNVHYQNAEALINELIQYNKQFQVMPYPNRSHGIYEGRNTRRHLYYMLTNYLKEKNPPGAIGKIGNP